MGRIVIPRPRLDRGGNQPKYRRQHMSRRHKFGPNDINLLMKALDAAVAVGGKVAGAVGSTQMGPQAAEAQKLADARQKKVSAAIAQQEATLGGSLSAEQRDQVRRTVIGREGAVKSAAAAEGAEAGASPHVQAFASSLGVPMAQQPAVSEASQRGVDPVIATNPWALAGRRQRTDMAHAAGFDEGTQERASREAQLARRQAREQRSGESRRFKIEQDEGGFAALPGDRRTAALKAQADAALKMWKTAQRIGEREGDASVRSMQVLAQARDMMDRALGNAWEPHHQRNLAKYVSDMEAQLGNQERAAELAAFAASDLPSAQAAPVLPQDQPTQQMAAAPDPPAAADPTTPAARPAQVEVLVDQAVMMPPGQVHAPLAADSLRTAEASIAAVQANRDAMWPTYAQLRRMDVGALQALGAYADTPQKRTQIMQAIRDSPDVQPTSVSDLLGMGEDHVRRAQKKALTIMKGSSKRGGLGPKDAVALAKSMYGLRVSEHQERRASELHPGKLTKQRLANEAARRKAEESAKTWPHRLRERAAKAKKAEADATKAARRAAAKAGGGARYKILTSLGNYSADYNDYKGGTGNYSGLDQGKKDALWAERAGPLKDSTPGSLAADFRANGGRRADRQIATNAGKALAPKPPKADKPPRTTDMDRVQADLKKWLPAAAGAIPSGPMDVNYSMVIAAGLPDANAGTIGYAITVLEEDEKRLVAEGATAAQINANRKVRGALSKKRGLVRQKGAPIDVKNMTQEQLEAMAR